MRELRHMLVDSLLVVGGVGGGWYGFRLAQRYHVQKPLYVCSGRPRVALIIVDGVYY
jgi:hypothetical protein